MKYKIFYKELKTIEVEGVNEEDAKKNMAKHFNRNTELPWNISIYDIEEMKPLKCKNCGKQLSYGDYRGDHYGLCEDGCDLG